jgi:hypothetical protein
VRAPPTPDPATTTHIAHTPFGALIWHVLDSCEVPLVAAVQSNSALECCDGRRLLSLHSKRPSEGSPSRAIPRHNADQLLVRIFCLWWLGSKCRKWQLTVSNTVSNVWMRDQLLHVLDPTHPAVVYAPPASNLGCTWWLGSKWRKQQDSSQY